jgi:hypothetical protein
VRDSPVNTDDGLLHIVVTVVFVSKFLLQLKVRTSVLRTRTVVWLCLDWVCRFPADESDHYSAAGALDQHLAFRAPLEKSLYDVLTTAHIVATFQLLIFTVLVVAGRDRVVVATEHAR